MVEIKGETAAHLCDTTTKGQKVVLHGDEGCGCLCKCHGGVPLAENSEVILASELVGTFTDQSCTTIKITFFTSCFEDCLMGCCYCGPFPVFPQWACRDGWCPSGSCCPRKTNTFALQQGHFFTFADKDTFFYHWLCCPGSGPYKRDSTMDSATSSGSGAPPVEDMSR